MRFSSPTATSSGELFAQGVPWPDNSKRSCKPLAENWPDNSKCGCKPLAKTWLDNSKRGCKPFAQSCKDWPEG